MWGWALCGAVVLPALLEAMASDATARARWLACAVVGAAIMFAGGLSARRRNKSWRQAALMWGAAFTAALTTYIGLGRVVPDRPHGFWRFVVSLWVLAATAGTFEDWRRSDPFRRLGSGILLGVVWVACLLPMMVLAISAIYAGDYLDQYVGDYFDRLFPPGAGDVVYRVSVILGGAASGLLLGEITDRILPQGSSSLIEE